MTFLNDVIHQKRDCLPEDDHHLQPSSKFLEKQVKVLKIAKMSLKMLFS